MKKVLLALTLVFAVFFASAKTTNKVAATKSIELQSNMTISKDIKEAKKGWEYLGIYDVYVDGVYVGTYHVWAYYEDAVAV